MRFFIERLFLTQSLNATPQPLFNNRQIQTFTAFFHIVLRRIGNEQKRIGLILLPLFSILTKYKISLNKVNIVVC
jgi:hypothetical protein